MPGPGRGHGSRAALAFRAHLRKGFLLKPYAGKPIHLTACTALIRTFKGLRMWTLTRKYVVNIAFVTALAIFTAIGWLAYQNMMAVKESVYWVSHTHTERPFPVG